MHFCPETEQRWTSGRTELFFLFSPFMYFFGFLNSVENKRTASSCSKKYPFLRTILKNKPWKQWAIKHVFMVFCSQKQKSALENSSQTYPNILFWKLEIWPLEEVFHLPWWNVAVIQWISDLIIFSNLNLAVLSWV